MQASATYPLQLEAGIGSCLLGLSLNFYMFHKALNPAFTLDGIIQTAGFGS